MEQSNKRLYIIFDKDDNNSCGECSHEERNIDLVTYDEKVVREYVKKLFLEYIEEKVKRYGWGNDNVHSYKDLIASFYDNCDKDITIVQLDKDYSNINKEDMHDLGSYRHHYDAIDLWEPTEDEYKELYVNPREVVLDTRRTEDEAKKKQKDYKEYLRIKKEYGL